MGCCESREKGETAPPPAANAEAEVSTNRSSSNRRKRQEMCPRCSSFHTPDSNIPTSSEEYMFCEKCRKKL